MSQIMKRLLPLAMFLMTGAMVAPANADLVHRLSTSTSLTVDGALTVGTRLGSTYSVSGTLDVGAYDINTAGSAFSFSESWTQGDATNAIGSGVDVTAGVVADMPAYGSLQTNSGGVAGNLAGTITSAGVMTLTAGGAGTNATGQFVSEITIR